MMILRTGVLAAVCLVFLSAASASAESSIADVQWAQRVLTEKGFDIGGRANGQMTGPTRSALKAYQKANGLPATGEVDQATIDKMMAGRTASPAQGSLSAPRPGSAPRALEKDVKPRAAPSERVQNEGGSENTTPALAPSGAVVGGGWMPGQPGTGGAMTQGVAGPVSGTQTTLPMTFGVGESATRTYARPLIAAILLGTLMALGGTWWLTGRRRRSAPDKAEAPAPTHRQEPTFGSARPVSAGPSGPLLTATRPTRR